ncbi:hypothetical protein PSI23_11950 [Xenorhabdus sp. XENO-10]|uniref:Uncharacterized protein n=1 Tax=Xenorhabdus yunnanensis TaxID=3025878 RepID=A0ABT5LJF0_9GAMM|nr:hypothetical protein [Xenorhabdus yunnanensis]MDC9589994.1 hypothetical protein [Xenorhabdus yunnanensis]
MQKNKLDSNNDIEIQQNQSTVSGYVSNLHVASPVSSNVTVEISDDYGHKLLENALLTYGISSSPGNQMLTVLELALVNNKQVKLVIHVHEGTTYIDSIGLIRE